MSVQLVSFTSSPVILLLHLFHLSITFADMGEGVQKEYVIPEKALNLTNQFSKEINPDKKLAPTMLATLFYYFIWILLGIPTAYDFI